MKYFDKFHPDKYYHIFNHAVGKENLFHSHDNYLFFLARYSKFLNSYAKAFNKQNNRKGALFIDFTKRKAIDNESYFTSVVNYIHQNAVYHGFCNSAQDWPYSSYNSILKTGKTTQLERNLIFDWFGGIEKFIDFHQNYEGTTTEITIEN
jgi:putative transposase